LTIPDDGSHVWQLDRMRWKGLLFCMHHYQNVHWDLGGECIALYKVKDRLTAPRLDRPGTRSPATEKGRHLRSGSRGTDVSPETTAPQN
jgi:hypothetical protein